MTPPRKESIVRQCLQEVSIPDFCFSIRGDLGLLAAREAVTALFLINRMATAQETKRA